MVTNKSVYNIKKNAFGDDRFEIQRCIGMDKVKGISIGSQKNNS